VAVSGGSFTRKSERPVVPSEMVYCQTRVRFTPEGRKAIQAVVDKMWQNETFLAAMVTKADIYMPHITDAFKVMGVPEDLKYISIQESGLRGTAVSRSNAVGWWQFKDFTAIEVGLTVNQSVDERMHLFRSSIGAARYFAKNYRRYDNWVYSVISYYEGGTGALPYLSRTYFGAKAMLIDENLHWYAQKAIAHKIVFESLIHKQKPLRWLEPVSNQGIVEVGKLRSQYKLSYADFSTYNPWARQAHLPKDQLYSVYVVRNGPYEHIRDPHADNYSPEVFSPTDWNALNAAVDAAANRSGIPAPPKVDPPPIPSYDEYIARYGEKPIKRDPLPSLEDDDKGKIKEYHLKKEPLYGVEWALTTEKQTIEDLALEKGTTSTRLCQWNGFGPSETIRPNTPILVVSPKKARIHIVRPRETLTEIAIRYKRTIDQLVLYNDFSSATQKLRVGQKIYLRDYKPLKEETIIYHTRSDYEAITESNKSAKPEPTKPPLPIQSGTEVPTHSQPNYSPTRNNPVNAEPSIINHTVQPKETLYSIARRYGMKVEQVRELNDLVSDAIQIGQTLRVVAIR
jgi:membrane-bound lytic murein transglycosylase D